MVLLCLLGPIWDPIKRTKTIGDTKEMSLGSQTFMEPPFKGASSLNQSSGPPTTRIFDTGACFQARHRRPPLRLSIGGLLVEIQSKIRQHTLLTQRTEPNVALPRTELPKGTPRSSHTSVSCRSNTGLLHGTRNIAAGSSAQGIRTTEEACSLLSGSV